MIVVTFQQPWFAWVAAAVAIALAVLIARWRRRTRRERTWERERNRYIADCEAARAQRLKQHWRG